MTTDKKRIFMLIYSLMIVSLIVGIVQIVTLYSNLNDYQFVFIKDYGNILGTEFLSAIGQQITYAMASCLTAGVLCGVFLFSDNLVNAMFKNKNKAIHELIFQTIINVCILVVDVILIVAITSIKREYNIYHFEFAVNCQTQIITVFVSLTIILALQIAYSINKFLKLKKEINLTK